MTRKKRFYRSRDEIIAGVCAGISDFFSVDPLVVRIFAVVAVIASGGLLGIAYLIFWAVVPKAPRKVIPLDVQPRAVHSYTYGTVDCGAARGFKKRRLSDAKAAVSAARRCYPPSYTGVAHRPPEPPLGAQQHCFPCPQRFLQRPLTASAKTVSRTGVWIALCVGSFLLFAVVVAVATRFVQNIMWWQYWPLLLIILGIVRMVVPGKGGRRMREFVGGLVCSFLGWLLLVISLGLIGQQSIVLMVLRLWPLLLVMAGFAIMGIVLKSTKMALLAGAFFAAFCFVGIVWFSVPGPMTEVVFTVPYGKEYHLDVSPDA